MKIKRQDLERLVETIRRELSDHNAGSLTEMWQALAMGNRLLRMSSDPVDVVPVQDYPFPIGRRWGKEWKLPDVVKPYSEGP